VEKREERERKKKKESSNVSCLDVVKRGNRGLQEVV